MAKYSYDNLSEDDFEDLVVAISRHMLGQGTMGFAKGRDGGRDAFFEGTTNGFPSEYSPWEGRTVIQAKHSNNPNASFSEPSFSQNKTSTLEEELPRIKRLRDNGRLDHYILFSNRKLTALCEEKIKDRISEYCDIPTRDIALIAIDRIDAELAKHPQIVEQLALDLRGNPLVITSEALAEVIEAMSESLAGIDETLQSYPVPRTVFARKNELNNARPKVMERLRSKYLKDEKKIRSFLEEASNKHLRVLYDNIVDELDDNIELLKAKGMTFDEAYSQVLAILFEKDPLLRKNASLVRRVVFYMYWNCDLGRSEDDA